MHFTLVVKIECKICLKKKKKYSGMYYGYTEHAFTKFYAMQFIMALHNNKYVVCIL